jgi:hypothetical protein
LARPARLLANGVGRCAAILDFLVFLVITLVMLLVSSLLLLSATIMAPGILFDSIVTSLRRGGRQ